MDNNYLCLGILITNFNTLFFYYEIIYYYNSRKEQMVARFKKDANNWVSHDFVTAKIPVGQAALEVFRHTYLPPQGPAPPARLVSLPPVEMSSRK